MVAHARLMSEFTEDEKYHNLMTAHFMFFILFMSYANNKGTDQPAHPHSLISAFVVRCLDSIPLLDTAKISQGRFESYLVGNSKDRLYQALRLLIILHLTLRLLIFPKNVSNFM